MLCVHCRLFLFCHGDTGGRSFLNGAPSLHVYDITFLVDSRVCGQRNGSLFSERPGEHTVSASPPRFCVGHFGELLENGGSGGKAQLPLLRSISSFLVQWAPSLAKHQITDNTQVFDYENGINFTLNKCNLLNRYIIIKHGIREQWDVWKGKKG